MSEAQQLPADALSDQLREPVSEETREWLARLRRKAADPATWGPPEQHRRDHT